MALVVAGTMLPIPKGLEAILGKAASGVLEARTMSTSKYKNTPAIINEAYNDTLAAKSNDTLETQVLYLYDYLQRRDVITATEHLSFYVYDIAKSHVVADINIDTQRMAASLIKPFVMAAAYDKRNQGQISSSQWKRMQKDLTAMIQLSDNPATNRVIDSVGGVRAVQQYIDRTKLFSKTKIVEKIPVDERTYKNRTSAHDLNILLNQIYRRRLVSAATSAEMLGILRGYHNSRIDEVALPHPGVKGLAGKTGFVYGLNGESTIIIYENKAGQERPFIFTALLEDRAKPYSRRTPAQAEAWGKTQSEIIRKIFELTISYYQSEMVDQYRNRSQRVERVAAMIHSYQERPDFITRATKRGKEYMGIIKEAARENNLEWEGLYSQLFVESAFQPRARSSTGPRGIAQFTAAAAKDMGLKVGKGVDERLHPRKAIFAAARLLRGHQDYFLEKYNNNPYVARDNAIAAYQLGRLGIIRGLDQERETSYWQLRDNTTENKEYVSRVLAVRKILFGI